jgi:hypothetical protein
MAAPLQVVRTIFNALKTIADHLPKIDVHVDNPTIHTEEFIGTDGTIDIFVFNAKSHSAVNAALLRNFDVGEDRLLFLNMQKRDLIVGDLGTGSNGSPIGSHLVFFGSAGGSSSILLYDVPYEQASIDKMVLPFNGQSVFDDPFNLI